MKLHEIAGRNPMFPMVNDIHTFSDVLKKNSYRNNMVKKFALKYRLGVTDFRKIKELKVYQPCLNGIDRISLMSEFVGTSPGVCVVMHMSYYPARGFDLDDISTIIVNVYDELYMLRSPDNISDLGSHFRDEMLDEHYDTPYFMDQIKQHGYNAVVSSMTEVEGALCSAWIMFK